jgi:hypothetical protein
MPPWRRERCKKRENRAGRSVAGTVWAGLSMPAIASCTDFPSARYKTRSPGHLPIHESQPRRERAGRNRRDAAAVCICFVRRERECVLPCDCFAVWPSLGVGLMAWMLHRGRRAWPGQSRRGEHLGRPDGRRRGAYRCGWHRVCPDAGNTDSFPINGLVFIEFRPAASAQPFQAGHAHRELRGWIGFFRRSCRRGCCALPRSTVGDGRMYAHRPIWIE